MKTLNLTTTSLEEFISLTLEVLSAGGLVIFPTETTYGAGVDATNPKAVSKLLAFKSRREGKPLSIAVAELEAAYPYVELNQQAQNLGKQFLPGPITIVCKGKNTVASGVESEFGTLGIRVPDYHHILELLKRFNKPITATSANGSGEKRPYSIQDIFDGLSEKQKSLIDLVIDAGELPHNPPSTVIDTTLSTPVTLRQGEITFNSSSISLISSSEQETKDIAKRLLLKHWQEIKDLGLVIGLDGALGSGKTIFTKGVAEFLQIKEMVNSPTYTYLSEYSYDRHGIKGKLFHLDMWKIDQADEVERLEIGKLFRPTSVIVIEWIHQVWEQIMPIITTSGIKFVHLSLEEINSQDNRSHRELKLHEI